MPVDETFTDDLSVTAGNPTKASEYNNLSNNSDAAKQRIEINHFFNNTGVANEDGYHKADWSDPTYFYQKDTGGAYMALWIDNSGTEPQLRGLLGTNKANATPGSEGAGHVILGAGSAGSAF